VGKERRIFERLSCNFTVEVRNPLTDSFENALGYDFSAAGLGLAVRHPLPPSEDVELRIQFSRKFEPVLHKAQVAWVRREVSGWWRIGLHFPPFKLIKFIPFVLNQ